MHMGLMSATLPDSYYCSFVSGDWNSELRGSLIDHATHSTMARLSIWEPLCRVRSGNRGNRYRPSYSCRTSPALSKVFTGD